jgi:hypothetical protein
MFRIFPGKPKNHRFMDILFIHVPDEFFGASQFCLRCEVEGFKGRLIRKKGRPVIPETGRKNMRVKIDNHL